MAAELDRARLHHGDMASAHEAYAVVLEELEEWWEEVQRHDRVKGLLELIQLAAMARRAAEDIYGVSR